MYCNGRVVRLQQVEAEHEPTAEIMADRNDLATRFLGVKDFHDVLNHKPVVVRLD